MSRTIVLAGAVRTAIGKMGGALSNTPAATLGSIVIKESLSRANVAPEQVDEVFMGCVLQAAQGQNVARQSAIHAGIPVEVPATTLNNLCGSGLKCVNLAASLIASGEADIIVAGGMENMSGAPYALPQGRYGYRMGNGTFVDTMINDALTDAFHNYHMGITAENVAEKYGITREMQDEFAASSQQKCEAAQKAGKFKDEIVPVPIKVKKDTVMFDTDEFPRAGVVAEGLAKLKPAFKKDGTVTAANASGINDGAAAIVVMSAEKAKELGVKPMAKFVAGASAGVDPSVMGIGPAYVVPKAIELAGLKSEDIDYYEINEAFAAQFLACNRELKLPMDKVNRNGSGIGLGHPVGMTGARIITACISEMLASGEHYGVASLCVGGGPAMATVLEIL